MGIAERNGRQRYTHHKKTVKALAFSRKVSMDHMTKTLKITQNAHLKNANKKNLISDGYI
jgi:hypothetical protein